MRRIVAVLLPVVVTAVLYLQFVREVPGSLDEDLEDLEDLVDLDEPSTEIEVAHISGDPLYIADRLEMVLPDAVLTTGYCDASGCAQGAITDHGLDAAQLIKAVGAQLPDDLSVFTSGSVVVVFDGVRHAPPTSAALEAERLARVEEITRNAELSGGEFIKRIEVGTLEIR